MAICPRCKGKAGGRVCGTCGYGIRRGKGRKKTSWDKTGIDRQRGKKKRRW